MILTPPASNCAATYACGPVHLDVTYGEPAWQPLLDGLLSQYDAPWPVSGARFSVTIEPGLPPADTVEPAGNYLRSYRLHVDRRGTHLISRSNVGVWMDFDEASRCARILVTPGADHETMIEEIEQQLVLLLARAWASEGWTPLHAGTLILPEKNTGVLVCAHSGVGKTTFTTAMLCHGWRTLGDDKALLRKEDGRIVAHALSRRFHLHPSLSKWFPQLGVIEDWPRYSRWTEKRMVKMGELWPDQLLAATVPQVVIQLARGDRGTPLQIDPLDSMATLNTLLRQIAIPGDAAAARPLVACAAALAGQLRGALVTVGENAFADPAMVGRIEARLRELLS